MPTTNKKSNFTFLSQIQINSTPTQSPIIPLKGKLAEGCYDSEIVSLAEVIEDGALSAVDFVHKLAGNGEKNTLVRFRLFYPRDTEKLIQIFSKYGFNGNFDDVVGMKETVTLTTSSKSQYLRITDRQLQALPASKPTGGRSSTKSSISTKKPTPNLLDEDDDEFDDFLDDED